VISVGRDLRYETPSHNCLVIWSGSSLKWSLSCLLHWHHLFFFLLGLVTTAALLLFLMFKPDEKKAEEKRPGIFSSLAKLDVALILYFLFWYIGNYYYNITNKQALRNSGGADGYPMTIATLQLGVGVIYALFLWVAPDARATPKITLGDAWKMVPVSFCSAAPFVFCFCSQRWGRFFWTDSESS